MTDYMEIKLGPLEQGPHANLIGQIARQCALDTSIQAMWVGGSLAAGLGDQYSDIDFHIAVEPGQVAGWISPDWENHLFTLPVAGVLMRAGEHALLHHLVLDDGTTVDFHVQDTAQEHPEPKVVILACGTPQLRAALEQFARPVSPPSRAIDGALVRQFFITYWIATHEQMKLLARKYHHAAFAALYPERLALLRAWYMRALQRDIDTRPTPHMLRALHFGLQGLLTQHQHDLLGLPSTTPGQTVAVIDAIRSEMATVGRWLAKKYRFAYPFELEEVVCETWSDRKSSLIFP